MKSNSVSIILPFVALLAVSINALPQPRAAFDGPFCSAAEGYEPCSPTNCANKLAPGVDCGAISAAENRFGLPSLKDRASTSSDSGSNDDRLSASTDSSGGQGTGSEASSSDGQGTQTSSSGNMRGLNAASGLGSATNSSGSTSQNSTNSSDTGSSNTGSTNTSSSDTGLGNNGLSASTDLTGGPGTGYIASSSNGQGTKTSSSDDTSGLNAALNSLPGFPENFTSLADITRDLSTGSSPGSNGLSAETSSSGDGQAFSSSSNGKETKTSKSGFKRRWIL